MSICYKKFDKKILSEDDNYFLELNLNLKFRELEYKLLGKENIIQMGILKKYKKNKKIKFLLESLDTVFLVIKVNNTNEFYEIIDKEDLINMKLDIKNNKNIEMSIEKKSIVSDMESINNLMNDFSLKGECNDDDDNENDDDNEDENEDDNDNNDNKEFIKDYNNHDDNEEDMNDEEDINDEDENQDDDENEDEDSWNKKRYQFNDN